MKRDNQHNTHNDTISESTKRNVVKQITEDELFRNSPTSIALLKYLTEANIDKRALKESIIDVEFFDSYNNSSSNNPRVRVNMYNLRNKLKSYYLENGKDDEIRVLLEKGSYDLRFNKLEKKESSLPIEKKNNWERIVSITTILALVSLVIISYLPKSKHQLWQRFFDNGKTINLFIGDSFGYGGKTISGQSGWTRDFKVNNLKDYFELLETKPELKNITVPTPYNYSTRMAEHATHDLTKYFAQLNKDFSINYATQCSFVEIKKANAIYVGRLKNQKDFVYLLNEASPYCKVEDKTFNISGHPSISDTTIQIITHHTEHDHAVVARLQGPDNTEQFFFFSDHDIGVMAMVEYFTNDETIQAFSETHLNESSYFIALFTVSGRDRVNLGLTKEVVIPLSKKE